MNLKKAKRLRKQAMELSFGMPMRELGYKAIKVKGRDKVGMVVTYNGSVALNRPQTFRAIYRDLKRVANGRKPIWHAQ